MLTQHTEDAQCIILIMNLSKTDISGSLIKAKAESVLAPQIAGHNLKNKLGLIKFGNYDKESKKVYT